MSISYSKKGYISNLISLSSLLTPPDIYNAVAKYRKLDGIVETYNESTDYNLVIEDMFYPPKPIFGLAMSELLGVQVKSSHFSDGLKSANFLIFERLGFKIRLKEGTPWSDDEMQETVKAYIKMHQLSLTGEKFNKAKIYRDLSNIFKRGAKSYEYRMQNISYVFELMGRRWVAGLKPKRNITFQQVEKIENLISIVESQPYEGRASFEAKVRELTKKTNLEKPKGYVKPRLTIIKTTSYVRSPEVKAWVINRANGECECCNKEAPFRTEEDRPFLEVHHIVPLTDGGDDTVENCACVCPNCHRMLHFGKDRAKYSELLLTKISRLER